jgi:hypothetical protein
MGTRALDLKGIPEPIARGLEIVAEMARNLVPTTPAKPKRRKRVKLTPVKGGRVLTSLTREDIYADDDE